MKLKNIPDRELLERIYSAQLATKMDIETILTNVVAVRKIVDPSTKENFHRWRHLSEIKKTMDELHSELIRQLNFS